MHDLAIIAQECFKTKNSRVEEIKVRIIGHSYGREMSIPAKYKDFISI